MVNWNPDLLHKFVAPGIADFTSASIDDLTAEFPQALYWLANHFLNNAVGTSFADDKARRVVIGILRRAHEAFRRYHDARDLTLKYLQTVNAGNPSIRAYYEAVSTWETFCLQMQMAYELYNWLSPGQPSSVPNDNSPEDRIRLTANAIKHTAGKIDRASAVPEHTLPLWLSDQGLHSYDVSVTYVEAASVLRDLARVADAFQNAAQVHQLRRDASST